MELGRVNTTDVRTTHTLTGLRPHTTYTITVRAYTIAGPGNEKILTVTTAAVRKFYCEHCNIQYLNVRTCLLIPQLRSLMLR